MRRGRVAVVALLVSCVYGLRRSCATVDEIVPVYAPSSDRNDVAAYIAAIKHAVDTWRHGQLWA
jgi:hypothetical protein